MGGADAPPPGELCLDPNGAFIDGKLAVVTDALWFTHGRRAPA